MYFSRIGIRKHENSIPRFRLVSKPVSHLKGESIIITAALNTETKQSPGCKKITDLKLVHSASIG